MLDQDSTQRSSKSMEKSMQSDRDVSKIGEVSENTEEKINREKFITLLQGKEAHA